MNKNFNPNAPYQSIADASRTTGLSRGYIRQLCVQGKIPVVKVGTKYMCDLSGLIAYLQKQSGQEA